LEERTIRKAVFVTLAAAMVLGGVLFSGRYALAAAKEPKILSFDTMVGLPQPCIAPIVFVTSPTGAWFAATGK